MARARGWSVNSGGGDRILVVGETIVDVIEGADGAMASVGGSPATVAVTLGRLGRAVTLATSFGDDDFGATAAQRFALAEVEVVNAPTEKTSVAHATIQDDGSAVYDFDVSWDIPALDPAGFRFVHAGSIAAFLEPGADAVEEIMRRAHASSRVSLDPNIRPALLGEPDAVRLAFERMIGWCDLVKLSEEDAEWLYPGRSARSVLEGVLAAGPRIAVMTLGGRGITLASHVAHAEVPAVRTRVVDTIGAGDSVMGALIDATLDLEGDDEATLRAMGEWAARVGAITVSRAGAEPPWRSELSEGSRSAVAPL